MRYRPQVLCVLGASLIGPIGWTLADRTPAAGAWSGALFLAGLGLVAAGRRVSRRSGDALFGWPLLARLARGALTSGLAILLLASRGACPAWLAAAVSALDVVAVAAGVSLLCRRQTQLPETVGDRLYLRMLAAYLVAGCLGQGDVQALLLPGVFIAWIVAAWRGYETVSDLLRPGASAWLRRGLPAAGLALVTLLVVVSQTSAGAWGASPPIPAEVVVIGHRGAAGLAPENTLAAVRAGLAAGAGAIEVDVHQTRDHELVVIHDDDTMRTTGRAGKIAALTLAEIRLLDAGKSFGSANRSERIPRLVEILDLVRPPARLIVEIKYGSPVYPGIEQRLVDLLTAKGVLAHCLVCSFDDGVLRQMRRLCPGLRLHKLAVGQVPLFPFFLDRSLKLGQIAEVQGVDGIALNFSLIHPDLVRRAHREGLTVHAWTVNDATVARQLTAMGVDGLITDRPDLIVAAKGR